MPIFLERKILDLRQGSYAICLPKAWLSFFGLGPGDVLEITGNGELTIRPKKRGKGRRRSLSVRAGHGSKAGGSR